MIAGNSLPTSYNDNAGSIARRLVVLRMKTPVAEEDKDPLLKERLACEIGSITRRINRAYRRLSAAHRGMDWWSVLPACFHDAKQDLQAQMNPLVRFLGSPPDTIEFNETAYVPFEDVGVCSGFQTIFNQWCRSNGITRPTWNPELYEQSLWKAKCRFEKANVRWPPGYGDVATRSVIYGMAFRGISYTSAPDVVAV